MEVTLAILKPDLVARARDLQVSKCLCRYIASLVPRPLFSVLFVVAEKRSGGSP